MTIGGTASYAAGDPVPPLVARAVAARARRFDKSCRAAHGRLLALLAGGIGDGVVG